MVEKKRDRFTINLLWFKFYILIKINLKQYDFEQK